ncbi:hypothetical protein [Williamsia sterculiae]|uniref:hypothetical protein n=1 Tax=Williamsia sterculiae TaxID=1344003 RepID=UPI00117CB9BB|nr:hypothetical protein [Williamsia sterculiae]
MPDPRVAVLLRLDPADAVRAGVERQFPGVGGIAAYQPLRRLHGWSPEVARGIVDEVLSGTVRTPDDVTDRVVCLADLVDVVDTAIARGLHELSGCTAPVPRTPPRSV